MAIGGWQLVAIGGWWRLVVGDWWSVAVGSGCWQLVAAGGWRLAVGGGWRLAVGGGFPKDPPANLNPHPDPHQVYSILVGHSNRNQPRITGSPGFPSGVDLDCLISAGEVLWTVYYRRLCVGLLDSEEPRGHGRKVPGRGHRYL